MRPPEGRGCQQVDMQGVSVGSSAKNNEHLAVCEGRALQQYEPVLPLPFIPESNIGHSR